MAKSIPEMPESPRWYKPNVRALSWSEARRMTPKLILTVLVYILAKTGLVRPPVEHIFRIPADFDRVRCEEGDVSMDAQLAMKPIIDTLVYECGFRVAAWTVSNEDNLSHSSIDYCTAYLQHESGLYVGNVAYSRDISQVIEPENSGAKIMKPEVKSTVIVSVDMRFASGCSASVEKAIQYFDVPPKWEIRFDSTLKVTELLPALQELAAKYIARGDNPLPNDTIDILRARFNENINHSHRFYISRGLYVPATEDEVSALRAKIAQIESQQR